MAIYRVLFHHFERFVAEYESRFEREYGYLKASMSRVLLLLDFDHRQRIQFFRAGEYAFRVQGAGSKFSTFTQGLAH
jgi:hypothetical protein